MGNEEIVEALASYGNTLPADAMREALARWGEVAPNLLAVLEAAASGADRSERAFKILFIALHLMGEKRETRAFAPLCRLAASDGDMVYEVLGDGVTTTYSRILIACFDGNVSALHRVIECAEADEFTRAMSFDALAYLAASGAVPLANTEQYLRDLFATLQPQNGSYVWVGWQQAVSLLGLTVLSSLVGQAFALGWIDASIMSLHHYHEDLAARLRDADPLTALARSNIGPLDDAVAELSGWYAFSEKNRWEEDRAQARATEHVGRSVSTEFGQPYINPLRHVGRNDPCPCGSGKKFKKCCLGKAA